MHSPEQLLEQVEELTWALVDEQITDEELARLEKMLLDNPSARKTYVECMQMHADLHFMFKQDERKSVKSGSSRLPSAVVNAVPMAGSHMPMPGMQR